MIKNYWFAKRIIRKHNYNLNKKIPDLFMKISKTITSKSLQVSDKNRKFLMRTKTKYYYNLRCKIIHK